MDTKGGKRLGGGGGGGVMNWEIGIDMYTLMCVKLMTNTNLLYKKIYKIKFKNSKKKTLQCLPISHNALDQYFGMSTWGRESDMMKVEGP